VIATTDGLLLTVHDFGGPSGAPILLMAHANGFHGQMFTPMASALRDRYRVVSFDFRGHGHSPAPQDHPMDWSAFADDVLAVVTHLGGGPMFGYGHSLGGASLVNAELARPGTFRSVVLFEPVVIPPAPARADGANPMAQGARRRRDVFADRASARATYASKPPMNRFDPRALDEYVEHGFIDCPDGSVTLACLKEHEARVFERGASTSTYDRLGELSLPIQLCGSDDPGPGAFIAALHAAIAGSEVAHYGDLTHFGPFEAPERLAADAARFWAAHG
jgi:pimeloyl-ACP methyl ester carboxylesterase